MSTTTSVVDDTSYYSASAPSPWTRATVSYGQVFGRKAFEFQTAKLTLKVILKVTGNGTGLTGVC